MVCTPFCQVEGCERLLRDEKPYYQRFLVCEEHMRCLSLDINGQLSRFCQQCGKFEPLEAFDDNKRYGHMFRPGQHWRACRSQCRAVVSSWAISMQSVPAV